MHDLKEEYTPEQHFWFGSSSSYVAPSRALTMFGIMFPFLVWDEVPKMWNVAMFHISSC